LVQIKVSITDDDFGPDYKLHQPKLHGLPPSEYTLHSKYFHRSRFLSNLHLPWNQSFPWKFSLYWIYFLSFRIFEQLSACLEQQRVPWIHCTKYVFFIIQDFLATCACPENRVSPETFHSIEYIFYQSGFLSNFALALKNRGCPGFIALTMYFNITQDFWATCSFPDNQSCPGIFHCIGYIFYHSGFLSNFALALRNRGCPEFIVLNMYVLSLRIFEQSALALKNRVALEFFTVLNVFFIIQDFWATSACPEKRVCPDIFQSRGAAVPSDSPPRTPMMFTIVWLTSRKHTTGFFGKTSGKCCRRTELTVACYWPSSHCCFSP